MKSSKPKSNTLIIGIGNSGRRDDGLGWAFVNEIQNRMPDAFDFEWRYQLQVEDSELICDYRRIIFVDASTEEFMHGFSFSKCELAEHYYFSSHAQNPETVVYLAATLYDAQPDAYMMAISGVEWELKEGLSERAIAHLQSAIDHFLEVYEEFETNFRTE